MDHHYAQYGQNGQQLHGQSQVTAHSHQQQQQQQQQNTDATTYYQQYEQYNQQYQQYQQYYEYYQQQQQHPQHPQHPPQYLQQQPTQQPASFLPPSYSTPLPPPKSKQSGQQQQQQQQQQGQRRQQTSNTASQFQYHAQYQTALQKGAAAASAVTAALFPSSFGNATATTSTTPTSTQADLSTPPMNESSQQAEWFSSYKPPTLQQRMAVTMAASTANAERQPHMNGRRNNNQRPGQRGNGSNNQRGKPKAQQTKEQEKEQSAKSKAVDGFHCDACDITFHEEAKLKIHASAHRSCPDCQYMASPSLVAEHRKVTHGSKNDQNISNSVPTEESSDPAQAASNSTTASSALAATMMNRPKSKEAHPQAPIKSELLHPLAPVLNTPEDIAAWIAKRRKAWPSESNILKKEQERQEMIAKGQIVEGSSSKDENGRNKRKKKDWSQDQRANAETVKKARTEGAAKSNDTTGSAMIECTSSNNLSEDENEDMDPVKDAVTSKDPSVMGKVLLPGDRPKRPRKPCKFFLKGSCTKGDRCTYGHDSTQAAKVQKSNQASVKKEVFRSRPSLLQMLLSSEIKEEKNKLLEALRYIVVNNFFEKEEPAGTLVEEVA
ncbi:hypothetical protein BGZ67_001493 [Mortierella alpina]|nr:hypothetical protein BGZ67_001493 [Mortierella alpina]